MLRRAGKFSQAAVLWGINSGVRAVNLRAPVVASGPLAFSSQNRYRSSLPINTGLMFVPQQEAWLVERMGAFHRVLEPGLNLLIPVIDRVKYVQSLKEIAIDIPQQSAITADNVGLSIDGVLYLKVQDPYLASYGVEDPEFAVTQLAQTTMRSELGKITLDSVFKERESLNIAIVEAINKASASWGIDCLRYEIRDIKLPPRVTEAMQMQVEAERKKRAAILESEGVREADINVAEGQKKARVLASEAQQVELVNRAQGEAEALERKAKAKAAALRIVANSLAGCGKDAASLAVAEQYVAAFSELAKETNTILLPANSGDMSSMVAQALGIYQKLQATPFYTGKNKDSPDREGNFAAHDPGIDPAEPLSSNEGQNSTREKKAEANDLKQSEDKLIDEILTKK
ncbi:stomatin-like protein 2, mitochondrial [Varroa jacobsoni]|uniref:stomatin-like protein 2, mitochondrial n=1 Tax=Varroa jacobsoni TaxID=62625 RepID=UPI000BF29D12|nr:stomatin-like protein 2, mitochondrial [Varroa jacobsoni]